jgi:hypothetical protein
MAATPGVGVKRGRGSPGMSAMFTTHGGRSVMLAHPNPCSLADFAVIR